MHGQLIRDFIRSFGRLIAVVAIASLSFFGLKYLSAGDPEEIAVRVRSAFISGDLGMSDYLPFDAHRGSHQYNDCNVLQMLSNPDPDRYKRALAPVIYKFDENFDVACPVLYAIVVEETPRENLLNFRYGRYWHGYNALTSYALRVMELKDVRRMFSIAVWVSIIALLIVSYRASKRLRLAGMVIGLCAALFWAVPYYGPNLTHGPGDAMLLFGLSVFVLFPGWSKEIIKAVPFAAGYGAVMVFFEALTGLLPIAVTWLAALTLAANSDEMEQGGKQAVLMGLAVIAAFTFGAWLTVLIKQVLSHGLAEPESMRQFLVQLRHYTAIPVGRDGWPGYLLPFVRLVQNGFVLTYGNVTAGSILLYGVLLTWLAAGLRAYRLRKGPVGVEILALMVAALFPAAWVVILMQHTVYHAGFMVRMLVVPISLAPLAMLWPRD
jgi:hypothetical protein